VTYEYQESPHSENTASPRSEKKGEKESMLLYQYQFQKDNLPLGCTNLTLAPTGSHVITQVQKCDI
jgi:hypothetical protein